MDIFTGGFASLVLICLIVHFYSKSVSPKIHDLNFQKFQRIYLIVYLLAMLGDWIQGPHVYALYESYNMTKHQIEILFIAGFGSSMLFGTIVGSFADKYMFLHFLEGVFAFNFTIVECGRRFNCMLYGLCYGIACLTKHFNNFYILMFGRLLAGIATSILYSAFESWLIYEHKQRAFDESSLGTLFANAYFGNSIVAIIAGVVAQFAANMFGYVAPFDVSLVVLVFMIGFIALNWTENHGDAHAQLRQSFVTAWTSIKTDRKVLLLGLVQSLFEGSMYVFVLEWTPALTVNNDLNKQDFSNPPIPHGFIFATFMVAMMIGSNVFKVLTKFQEVEAFMRPVLLVSAVTLAVPVLFSGNQFVIFVAFIVFEICVGIFWPSMGTMRGRYVPEAARSTIMNFFRIPLNLIVVLILWQDLQLTLIFKFCVVFLLFATGCQFYLQKLACQKAKAQEQVTMDETIDDILSSD